MGRQATQEGQLTKRGVYTDFNIMVCGAAGIGKTSFIDLFLKKFNLKAARDLLQRHPHQANQVIKNNKIIQDLHPNAIREATLTFKEHTICSPPCPHSKPFRLTMIDSAGYGNKAVTTEWQKSISDEL